MLAAAALLLLRRRKQRSRTFLESMTSSSCGDQLERDEIEFCKRPDGSDWLLGEGAFGKARFQKP